MLYAKYFYTLLNRRKLNANKFILRYERKRKFVYDVTWVQVPGGPHKKELLENLDRVPTYVQQLQFTVKNPTVGKAATFTKVDNVIQETKNLMNVISKVVTTCFVCATKVSHENIRYAPSIYFLNKRIRAFVRIFFMIEVAFIGWVIRPKYIFTYDAYYRISYKTASTRNSIFTGSFNLLKLIYM